MAWAGGHDLDELLQKPSMRGTHVNIVRILRDVGCNPKSNILERVENDISEELIAENRDYVQGSSGEMWGTAKGQKKYVVCTHYS